MTLGNGERLRVVLVRIQMSVMLRRRRLRQRRQRWHACAGALVELHSGQNSLSQAQPRTPARSPSEREFNESGKAHFPHLLKLAIASVVCCSIVNDCGLSVIRTKVPKVHANSELGSRSECAYRTAGKLLLTWQDANDCDRSVKKLPARGVWHSVSKARSNLL